MKRPTIAKILHLAADKFLGKDADELLFSHKKEKYSCFAIDGAIDSLKLSSDDRYIVEENIYLGLHEMGLIGGLHDFQEFYDSELFGWAATITPETQGARYAWLKFAALIAEEQGV